MVKFRIKNQASFEKQLRISINVKVARIIANSESFLLKQAEILRDKFASSPEFAALQGKLVGEFGFTPEEVSDLSRILDLLVPNNEITKLNLKISSRKQEVLLEWVDFAELKNHRLARHELTRRNPQTKNFELTEITSWVEWLEEGKVVRGYIFSPTTNDSESTRSEISRSGEGVMQKVSGGFWEYAPTKIFSKIANSLKRADVIRGFGAVLRRSK